MSELERTVFSMFTSRCLLSKSLITPKFASTLSLKSNRISLGESATTDDGLGVDESRIA